MSLLYIVTGTNLDSERLCLEAQKCRRHFAVLSRFGPVTMLAVSIPRNRYCLSRDGLESEDEFDQLSDVAHGLWFKQKKRRDRCVDRLGEIGVKALGPILYVVEVDAAHDDESPEDYDNFNNACLEAVKRIGRPALPILNKYIMEDEANMMVNSFAQEAVFEILGLDDEEKKNVCKHREAIGYEKNGKRIRVCAICEKALDEEEWG